MPKDLTIEECLQKGIKFAGRIMDNGEERYSVNLADASGWAYILTRMAKDQKPEWQNSHYHGGALLKKGQTKLDNGVVELILVLDQWVAAADLMPDGTKQLAIYEKGEYWISQPGIPHNIYMPSGATTHCLKYGVPVGNPEKNGADWYPAPEDFDAWTKSLDQTAIFKQLGLTPVQIKKYATPIAA